MYRSVFVLTILVFMLAACDKLPGNQGGSAPGTASHQISTGPVTRGNGGINFGGWYRQGGDNTGMRHVAAKGPSDSTVLWEYDFITETPVRDPVNPSYFAWEPVIDADGNLYLAINHYDHGWDRGNEFEPKYSATESIGGLYELHRKRPGCLQCISPDGLLKWKAELASGLPSIATLTPAGYVAVSTTSDYVPDEELDAIIANAKALTKKTGKIPFDKIPDTDEMTRRSIFTGTIQLIDSHGRTAVSHEHPDKLMSGLLVTSTNQILSNLTDREFLTSPLQGSPGPGDNLLVSCALDGTELWSTTAQGWFEPLSELPDERILCRNQVDDSNSNLVALDGATGDIAWEFKPPSGGGFEMFLAEENRRIAVLEQQEKTPELNSIFYLDYDGEVIAEHPYGVPFVKAFTVLGDGSIIARVNHDEYAAKSFMYESRVPDKLVRLSPEGEVIWSREYEFLNVIMVLVSDADDVIYATWGKREPGYSRESRAAALSGVMALDADGEVLWMKVLGSYQYRIDLVLGPDGTLYCLTDEKLIAIGDRQ